MVCRSTFRPRCSIPRPDTEVLATKLIDAARGAGACRILDLCAGSGCIGLAAAANLPNARVLLGEYDEEALKICRQNIRRNRLTARVASLKIDAREKPARTLGEFQFLVSNPPYIPSADIDTLDASVREHEPRLALDGGADGLDFYRVICEKWRDALCENGMLFFEVGIGQADQVLLHHALARLWRHSDRQGPQQHPPRGVRHARGDHLKQI